MPRILPSKKVVILVNQDVKYHPMEVFKRTPHCKVRLFALTLVQFLQACAVAPADNVTLVQIVGASGAKALHLSHTKFYQTFGFKVNPIYIP